MKYQNALVILLAFLLAACNPSDSIPEDWKKYENQELGVSYELPVNWVMQESDHLIQIASTQESLDDIQNGEVVATITLGHADEFDGISNPSDILDLFMEFFESNQTELVRLGNPKPITIQELPAATVAYHGTVQKRTGDFSATVIANEDHIGLVFTVDGSENSDYREILEHFVQSISVYPPASE